MTARALHVLGAVAWGAMVAAALLWWAPSLALALGTLAANRARFALTMARVQVLRAIGTRAAAQRVCKAALSRCERRRRMLTRKGLQP